MVIFLFSFMYYRVQKNESLYSGYCGNNVVVKQSESFCSCGTSGSQSCEVDNHLENCRQALRDITKGENVQSQLNPIIIQD